MAKKRLSSWIFVIIGFLFLPGGSIIISNLLRPGITSTRLVGVLSMIGIVFYFVAIVHKMIHWLNSRLMANESNNKISVRLIAIGAILIILSIVNFTFSWHYHKAMLPAVEKLQNIKQGSDEFLASILDKESSLDDIDKQWDKAELEKTSLVEINELGKFVSYQAFRRDIHGLIGVTSFILLFVMTIVYFNFRRKVRSKR